MRAIVFITSLAVSLIGNAQVLGDTILCRLLNNYRYEHGLQLLTWDSNIYREAYNTYTYEDSLVGRDSLIDIDSIHEPEIGAFAGVYGDYISGSYLFDGDSSAIRYIDSLYFLDIINNPGERSLLIKPKTGKMACLIEIKERYVNNPDKKSTIRQFSIWYVTIMAGVSY